jgi:chromosomal replication initiator protein
MPPRSPAATFARIVKVPENHLALAAVQGLAARFASGASRSSIVPLYLHGPSGTGKSTLIAALVEEAVRRSAGLVASVIPAAEWGSPPSEQADAREACDLLVVEDLHQLRPQAFKSLTAVLDSRVATCQASVFTAHAGPQELGFPARLASRLAAGLVVRLQPLQASSRLALLLDKAQRRQIAVSGKVLSWVATQLSGGARQLDGALTTLALLSRTHGSALDVATVAKHFHEQVEASRLTVDRIVQNVGRHFRIEPRRLCSEQRSRCVLLPRQVGMYLTRQLTPLSLQQIGRYFGGRDHSTVLHACRKVQQALGTDPALSGAIRQLHAELC